MHAAPDRRVDNLITRTHDAAAMLRMHAVVAEEARATHAALRFRSYALCASLLALNLSGTAAALGMELELMHVGGVGAAGLAQGLKTNAKLASLGLWKNPIGDDGAVALAEALRVNTALKSVALHACGITANGTAHLLDALMTNTALENLDLSGNKIGDAGALEVARWLQNHPQTSLASLELRGADITAAGAQAIADVVWPRPPPHLIDLDLRGNIISRGVSVGDHMGELPPPIQWDGPDGQYYQ